MRTEIRISGFGGQGIGLAGHIIGKAFAIFGGKEAVMTQAYGPEARGGASSANIIVSETTIDYPFVVNPDILLALSQEAYRKFRPVVKKNGLVLIDSGLVTPDEADSVRVIPATKLAEELGDRIVTNMVMLGYFTAVTGIIAREHMESAIETSVKARYLQHNMRAFEAGISYATVKLEHQENILNQGLPIDSKYRARGLP